MGVAGTSETAPTTPTLITIAAWTSPRHPAQGALDTGAPVMNGAMTARPGTIQLRHARSQISTRPTSRGGNAPVTPSRQDQQKSLPARRPPLFLTVQHTMLIASKGTGMIMPTAQLGTPGQDLYVTLRKRIHVNPA